MRDQIKKPAYFETVINERNSSHLSRLVKLKENLIKPDRLKAVKVDMAKNCLYTLISKFSFQSAPVELLTDYKVALILFSEEWDGYWKYRNQQGEEYNQYILSAYDEMLWMLSLGYLLDVSEEEFRKLVAVIDRDNVKDCLFEFIISAKIKDRAPIKEESYREHFGVPQVFAKLRTAIVETDKTKAEQLVKEFITKDWYKNHRDAGWYNSHKSPHNAYFGYWSFETAAVVKIMGLDDSSFRDCQYYPKDLL